jgi:hypothetical protein
MSKVQKGDPNIDLNTDMVCEWFEKKVLNDVSGLMRNLSSKRIKRLGEVIEASQKKLLPAITKYQKVRLLQSPTHRKNLTKQVESGVLDLS